MCTVASTPAAFRVRVGGDYVMGTGATRGRPPPEGANVGYALTYALHMRELGILISRSAG